MATVARDGVPERSEYAPVVATVANPLVCDAGIVGSSAKVIPAQLAMPGIESLPSEVRAMDYTKNTNRATDPTCFLARLGAKIWIDNFPVAPAKLIIELGMGL